jgi:hypothetical protein
MDTEKKPSAGQKVHVIKTDDGRSIQYSPGQMVPLDYKALLDARANGETTYSCRIDGIKPADTVGVFEKDEGQQLTVSMTLSTTYGLDIVGLVLGGWLPPIEAVANRIVIPDRNVVSGIRARFLGGKKKSSASLDAIDFLADVSMRVSPLLFAIEGNKRRFPEPSEAVEQYHEAAGKLRECLPHADVDALSPDRQRMLIKLTQDCQLKGARSLKFLQKAVPLIASPVSKSRRDLVWDKIVATAYEVGLSPRSLSVIACLSTAASPQNVGPARGLIKPKAIYTKEDAYNAFSDILSLEMLLQFQQLFASGEMTLLTADRDLALFWSALRINKIKGRDFTMNLGNELFPGISQQKMLEYSALPLRTSSVD